MNTLKIMGLPRRFAPRNDNILIFRNSQYIKEKRLCNPYKQSSVGSEESKASLALLEQK